MSITETWESTVLIVAFTLVQECVPQLLIELEQLEYTCDPLTFYLPIALLLSKIAVLSEGN